MRLQALQLRSKHGNVTTKYIRILGLIITSLMTTGLTSATSASAAIKCRAVIMDEVSSWDIRNNAGTCEEEVAGHDHFTKTTGGGVEVPNEPTAVCYAVLTMATEQSNWENANCTNENSGKGYIKVKRGNAGFASNSGSTKGISKSGAVTLEGGGATLTCTSSEGTWTILSETGGATKGAGLHLTFVKWSGCKVKTGSITATPIVKECTLELEAEPGEFKVPGAVITNCTIEVKVLFLTCIITMPESQGGLEANLLENVGKNLLVTANDSGITTKPSGTCSGVKETKEAKLKAAITGEELKKE
jgi:hypothetical protein